MDDLGGKPHYLSGNIYIFHLAVKTLEPHLPAGEKILPRLMVGPHLENKESFGGPSPAH